MATRAQKEFVRWVQQNDPFLFEVAKKRLAMRQDMGAIDWGGIFKGVADTVKNVAPTLVQYQSQKKVLDMQMKRAEQGLPPADVQNYSPVVRVAAEMTPETEAAATRVAQQSVKTGVSELMPLFLLGGLGAFFLLNKKRR